MIGETLVEIRAQVERLASDDGAFYLACARTGEHPVPAAGKRFPDRASARSAARATERYRAALRRYDPRVPRYDVVVHESRHIPEATAHTNCVDDAEWSLSEPVVAGQPSRFERWRLVSFCHDVAAAVFESLSVGGYDRAETAVMDAYFDLADRVSDPDDLCLCLLESMATALDATLEPGAQVAVLTDAADRLGPPEVAEDPVVATFARFQRLGLFSSYARSPWSADADGSRSTVVDVVDYALEPHECRLPVLPVVLDLYRRRFDRNLARVRAREIDEGWRITLTSERIGTNDTPSGLVSAPIEETV